MLDELDRDFEVKSVFKLCPANADGDNLIIDGITFPLLRQQVKKKRTNLSYASATLYALCLRESLIQ